MLNMVSFQSVHPILASGPMIETMMQWKPVTAFGATPLLSTIWYCLKLQQRLKRDKNPTHKTISPEDIAGKTMSTTIFL